MAEDWNKVDYLSPDYIAVLAELNRMPEKAYKNLKSAFGIITEKAADTIGVQRANIWLFTDAQRHTLRCIDAYDLATGKHTDGATLNGKEVPRYIEALKNERVIKADDAPNDPRTSEFTKDYFASHNIKSMLDAPIRQDGEVVGVICLEQVGTPRTWSDEQASFVATLSDFATIALVSHHKDLAETALIQSQKMESLGRLASGVAHDFNNILTVITGAVETLQVRWDAGPEHQKLLSLIADAGERARKVTRNLLAFGGQQTLNFSTFSCADLLDAVQTLTANLIREDITVEFIHNQTPCWIHGDQTQLEQVLLNLMINSVDAMPEQGHLIVEMLPPDAQMRTGIAVIDTGYGIPEHLQERIFDPFFSSKGEFGSGLGLSISLGIVQQHGGSLICAHSGEDGTRFEIRLPQVSQPETETPTSQSEAANPQSAQSVKILLVEDEPNVRDIVTQMLSAIGHEASVASDANEALDILGKEDIGLLISDVIMPGMRGPELYQLARAQQPLLPALFISGYTEEVIADIPHSEVRVGYLSKPFTLNQLSDAITNVLANAPA